MKAYGRLGEALAATLLLLAPAMWNGFPFLQYDSGGYLARWFEGYLVPSRSTVYGLFAVAGWPLDFWPEVLLQAAAAVWIISLVLRVYGLGDRPLALLGTVAALAATTSLPWIAGILLTDIFAGHRGAGAAPPAVRSGRAEPARDRRAGVAGRLCRRHPQRDARGADGDRGGGRPGAALSARPAAAAGARARRRRAGARGRDAARHQLRAVGPVRLDAGRLWHRVRAHDGGRHRGALSRGPLPGREAPAVPLSPQAAAHRGRVPVERRSIQRTRPLRRTRRRNAHHRAGKPRRISGERRSRRR